MKRKIYNAFILLTEIILLIILIGVIFYIFYMNSESPDSSNDSSTENTIDYSSSDATIDKSLYKLSLGYTYYVHKEALQLYADIVPMSNNKVFVTGAMFHEANYVIEQIKDASIKEEFYIQEDGVTYKNLDNTMTLTIDGEIATFIDKRVTVSIPFNGSLELVHVESPKPQEIEDLTISTTEASTEVSEDDTVVMSGDIIDGIIIDTYDTNITPDNYIGKDIEKYLIPENERKDYTITAKYIETATNSGVKYQDIYTGIYFYTFGSGFPYDPKVCNTVTITATYRGNEKRFNGLQMDDRYPCFVTKSIRKPNKTEIGQ